MYAAAITILIFGRLEDKRKNKLKLVIAGYFILAIAGFSYIFVTDIQGLFVVQIINAIGVGILTPAWRTTYALSEDKGRETLEWSFVDGGGKFAIATGAIIGSFIYKYYGFKAIFILIGIIQLIAAFISLRLLKESQA
jgi:predicted MFS family arabinose efflux permease